MASASVRQASMSSGRLLSIGLMASPVVVEPKILEDSIISSDPWVRDGTQLEPPAGPAPGRTRDRERAAGLGAQVEEEPQPEMPRLRLLEGRSDVEATAVVADLENDRAGRATQV